MTDEQRLQHITKMLILVRDNLFRGMSKSIQKLQARSINETLGLQNFIESPPRPWVGLTDDEIEYWIGCNTSKPALVRAISKALKEKNT